jgi:hypothetical protein
MKIRVIGLAVALIASALFPSAAAGQDGNERAADTDL